MSDSVFCLSSGLEGRYAIECELGEGGMATVYLADDLHHEHVHPRRILGHEWSEQKRLSRT